MQKFDENTLEFQYIQNLLYNFYVPTVDYFSNDDEVTYQFPTGSSETRHTITYITDNCVKSKTFYRDRDPEVSVISSYEFGKSYPNITTNFISRKNYYSSDLHEHLGDYLRWYKKYKKINLMSMYNCFSNRYIDDFSLPIKKVTYGEASESKSIITGSEYNIEKRLFAFPVKLGMSYRIACDNSLRQVTCQLALFNGSKLVTPDNNYEPIPEQYLDLKFATPSSYSVASNIVPKSYEKYLYLFIELPALNNSSIVVLEDDPDIENYCQNPSLLAKNYFTQHAFSDRLFEFLTGSVIIPGYEIQESIATYQRIMASERFEKLYGRKLSNYTKGFFDQGEDYTMHSFIYNTFRNAETIIKGSLNKELIQDFTGYIDKDIEELILAADVKQVSRTIEDRG